MSTNFIINNISKSIIYTAFGINNGLRKITVIKLVYNNYISLV